MSRGLLALAVWVFGLALPTSALAELGEERREVFYDFRSEKGASWHDAMMAATPIRQDGRKFAGYTRWVIEWRYRYQPDAAGICRLTELKVDFDVEITLPRWRQPSPEFVQFARGLAAHEEGHYTIARLAAIAIDRRLPRLHDDDCADLERRADALAYRILDDAKSREKRYDRVTHHGRDPEAWDESFAPEVD